MNIRQQINQLLSTDMTRHEFLVAIGLTLVAVVGFSGALRHLTENIVSASSRKTSLGSSTKGYGYGSSPYGR
jgi:hypothetical protein